MTMDVFSSAGKITGCINEEGHLKLQTWREGVHKTSLNGLLIRGEITLLVCGMIIIEYFRMRCEPHKYESCPQVFRHSLFLFISFSSQGKNGDGVPVKWIITLKNGSSDGGGEE